MQRWGPSGLVLAVRLAAAAAVVAVAVTGAASPGAGAVNNPTVVVPTTPTLVAAGATSEAAPWTVRPPDSGWTDEERIEIQVGPPGVAVPKGRCGAEAAVVFADVPAVSVAARAPSVKATLARGACADDTLVLTFSGSGKASVELTSISYDVGASVPAGLVSVKAAWVTAGSGDVLSPVSITAMPNARVAGTATLTAVDEPPTIRIGEEGPAASWRLIPGSGKRWERGEVVTVTVADEGGTCGQRARLGFATEPSITRGGPIATVTLVGPGPGSGCELHLALAPTQATAGRPVDVTGIRYVAAAGARAGLVDVEATSNRTIVDSVDAANAELVSATPGPTGTTPGSSDPTPPPGSTTTLAGEEGGDGWAGAAVLAALAVALVGGIVVVARRLLVVTRPADLSTFADRHLGRGRGPSPAGAGPAARRVAARLGGPEWADPFLVTLLWDAYVTVRGQRNAVVVRHAGGTRHDLVVFDENHPGRPRPSDVRLDPAGYDASDVAERLGLDPIDLKEALLEVAGACPFRTLVAPAPKLVPLAGPAAATGTVPAVEVAGEPIATTGVRIPGETLAYTTALHAVDDRDDFQVDGHAATVTARHAATDSCLLEVPGGTPAAGWDIAGPLRLGPRLEETVRFFGAASGAATTYVTGWDPDILTIQQIVASKVYTPPDTAPGDSGAALLDSENHVLGFAAYITGIGARTRFSVWVWADQVFRALHIAGPADEGGPENR
ncbi:MAG TPA: hypothetical protein VFJ85_03355 [Acidimicrobiales bacterium]|nr:hypothetical protein [Acidimicrobiales bacterium]